MSAWAQTELFRYRLPLVRPLTLPSGTHEVREGVLLRLTDDEGRQGWGEAAPLPGYSPDTLAETIAWFRVWAAGKPTVLAIGTPDAELGHRAGGIGPRRPVSRRPVSAHLARAAEGLGLPRHSPSAMWAIVQAGAEIESVREGRPLPQVYAGRNRLGAPRETVALNALLLGDREQVLRAARLAEETGYRAAKLKVGGEATAAAALAREVAAALGPVALRLDANGAWTLAEALAFAAGLGGVAVEYVEEPLADVADLPALARRAPRVRWALDEGLGEALANPAVAAAMRAAVVKPMLGAARVWAAQHELVRGFGTPRSEAARGPVVVSSVFESGVGMRHLVALAAALGDAPAGLDTYGWLAEDVLARRLPLAGPTVDVAAVLAPNAVDLGRLTPVPL